MGEKIKKESRLDHWKQGYSNSLCYELKSLGLDNRTTLVLNNTRELDRVPSTK